MLNIEFNEILHQPTRTRIIAYLATFGKVDYSTLKKTLELTDGVMSTHMKVLVNNEYVAVNKFFQNNKPKTEYELTEAGRKAFIAYLENLKQIIKEH